MQPMGNGAGSLATLVFGSIAALIGLLLYGSDAVNPEDFALRPADHRTFEQELGVPFTAARVSDMRSVLERNAATASVPILWLGNSQLHTINQHQSGDHLAPHWLRELLRPKLDALPLGFSLPNANLQEHLVVHAYTSEAIRPRMLLIALVFDDLREDDLRSDFSEMLTPAVRRALTSRPTSREIVSKFDSVGLSAKASEEGAVLEGFAQQGIERNLNEMLARASSLWANRSGLRSKVFIDLYLLRNAVLGIKATSVRPMIPARYERNMAALEALFESASSMSIPVLAYIAPLRIDVAPPYEAREYRRWKDEVHALAQRKSVHLENLEDLVPGPLWGTYVSDEVDFMHFMGEGHRVLARALAPHVLDVLGRK